MTVLEARDRIGGRCNTNTDFGKGPLGDQDQVAVDLGAQIVTGLIGNPLRSLCEQLKIRQSIIGAICLFFSLFITITSSVPLFSSCLFLVIHHKYHPPVSLPPYLFVSFLTSGSDAHLKFPDGKIVAKALDDKMDKLFNQSLEEAEKLRYRFLALACLFLSFLPSLLPFPPFFSSLPIPPLLSLFVSFQPLLSPIFSSLLSFSAPQPPQLSFSSPHVNADNNKDQISLLARKWT